MIPAVRIKAPLLVGLLLTPVAAAAGALAAWRFGVEAVIAEGGFGIVYRARQAALDRAIVRLIRDGFGVPSS